MMRKLRARIAATGFATVLAVALHAPAPVDAHSDPVTEIEKFVGKELARGVASSEGTETDPLLLPYVRGIGAKVSAQSPRRNVNYTFSLANNDIANAFALPGGYIFVTRGMLDEVASDDELATIMAHETGHVAERHAQKEIGENIAFLALLSSLGGSKYDSLRTGATVVNLLATLSLSRSYELQADHVGIGFAFHAGYDPRGLVEFFKGFSGDNPSALARYFDTHPTPKARIADALTNPLVTKPTPELRDEAARGYEARGLNHAAALVRRGLNPLTLPPVPPLPPVLPDYVRDDRADVEKRVTEIRKHLHSAGKTEDVGSVLQQITLINNQVGDLRWLVIAAEAYAMQSNVDNLYARTLRVVNVAEPTFDSLTTSTANQSAGVPPAVGSADAPAAAPTEPAGGHAELEAALGRSEIRGALGHAEEAPIPIRHAAIAISTVLLDLNNRFYQPRGAAVWARYGADVALLAYAYSELAKADRASGIAWRMISVARVRRYQLRLDALIPQADPAKRALWFDLAQRRLGTTFPNDGPTGAVTVRAALATELGVSPLSLDDGRADTTWADWVLKKKGSPENVATAIRLLTLDLERETAADDRRE